MYKKILSLFVLCFVFIPLITKADFTILPVYENVGNIYICTNSGAVKFQILKIVDEYTNIGMYANTPCGTSVSLPIGDYKLNELDIFSLPYNDYFFNVIENTSGNIGGGGIISTDTTSSVFSQFGEVTTDTFGGVLPYMLLFMGVYIAFYIIKSIIKLFVNKKTGRVLKEVKGYHKLKGRKGQDIGWEKDNQ